MAGPPWYERAVRGLASDAGRSGVHEHRSGWGPVGSRVLAGDWAGDCGHVEAGGRGEGEEVMTTYQREPADTLWPEIMPLLIEHKDEVSAYADIVLNPDVDRYNAVE